MGKTTRAVADGPAVQSVLEAVLGTGNVSVSGAR